MKYVIFENEHLKEVQYKEYQRWIESEGGNATLPSFSEVKEDVTYTIDTDFHGAFEEDEPVRPFVLFYSVNDETNVEHYYSIEELQVRRQQLINDVQAKAA